MSTDSQLASRHCKPCEGGVEPLSAEQSRTLLDQLDEWNLSEDGLAIYRKRSFRNFNEALAYLNRVGELAEAEQHHPDLHLSGYRNVRIELTTHAIGGLSDNDFILAAKIDRLA